MSNNQSSNRSRSGGVLALVIAIVALALFQFTGVDLLGIFDETPADPTPSEVVVPNVVETVDMTAPISVVFSQPTGSRDSTTYINGADEVLAAAIMEAEQTIDIAAFELNSVAIANALLDRHQNGVVVRIVTDDDHGLDVSMYEEYLATDDEGEREDLLLDMEQDPDDTLLDELLVAGIPIVDDDRSALMHNKFVIIDGAVVWMGSMNLTVNGSYRNNNNFNRIQSRRVVEDYQIEFNEMFEDGLFGPRSPANTPNPLVTVNGVPVEVYFAPEDGVITQVIAEVEAAQNDIKFMAFSYTENTLGEAMIAHALANDITIEGVFETVGSLTEWSEMTKLFCAGFDVRQDGNPFILHHKVMIIDDETVIMGSFNFSGSATESNDENMMIVHDADFAAQYVAEWQLRYDEGHPPAAEDMVCPE